MTHDDIASKTVFQDELANFVWNHSVSPMAFVDKRGKWLRVNPALCDLLEYSPTELKSMDFQHVTHPADVDWDMEMIQACLDHRISGYPMTKRYITKRNETIWIKLRVDIVRDDESGEHIFFLSQISPKEDHAVIDKLMKKNNDTVCDKVIESPISNELTVAQIGRWIRDNWKSIMPIFGVIGFIIFYVIKNFLEYFGKM